MIQKILSQILRPFHWLILSQISKSYLGLTRYNSVGNDCCKIGQNYGRKSQGIVPKYDTLVEYVYLTAFLVFWYFGYEIGNHFILFVWYVFVHFKTFDLHFWPQRFHLTRTFAFLCFNRLGKCTRKCNYLSKSTCCIKINAMISNRFLCILKINEFVNYYLSNILQLMILG